MAGTQKVVGKDGVRIEVDREAVIAGLDRQLAHHLVRVTADGDDATIVLAGQVDSGRFIDRDPRQTRRHFKAGSRSARPFKAACGLSWQTDIANYPALLVAPTVDDPDLAARILADVDPTYAMGIRDHRIAPGEEVGIKLNSRLIRGEL